MKEKIVLFAFFLSGMSALIYEVVWTRPLQLVFGSTVYAVATILTAFMAGLALGSFIGAKLLKKIDNPLYVFAIIEAIIALYGIAVIAIFNWLPYPYLAIRNAFQLNFTFFTFLQFLLAFLVLILPTTLMGMTWPIVNKAFIKDVKTSAETTGILYSVNTFGAIFGSFAGGFFLIPAFGVQMSTIFAAVSNFIAAGLVYFFGRER